MDWKKLSKLLTLANGKDEFDQVGSMYLRAMEVSHVLKFPWSNRSYYEWVKKQLKKNK